MFNIQHPQKYQRLLPRIGADQLVYAAYIIDPRQNILGIYSQGQKWHQNEWLRAVPLGSDPHQWVDPLSDKPIIAADHLPLERQPP